LHCFIELKFRDPWWTRLWHNKFFGDKKMTSNKKWSVAGCVSLVVMVFVIWSVNTATVDAQVSSSKDGPKPEVTMIGRVVDLSCFMTGEYPSADHAKCTADCLRNGVPAGLETDKGLIILGHGITGPAKVLMPFAFKQAEVRGMLFEKGGIKYLNIISIQEAKEPHLSTPLLEDDEEE
jgi:hypothetical protein